MKNHAREDRARGFGKPSTATSLGQLGASTTPSWCPAASASAASKARSTPRALPANSRCPTWASAWACRWPPSNSPATRRPEDANSTEFEPDAPTPSSPSSPSGKMPTAPSRRATPIPTWRHHAPGRTKLRRGQAARWHQIYGDVVTERHRHRYEANVNYLDKLRTAGLVISGPDAARATDRNRGVPAKRPPWFCRCAIPPEFKSTPLERPPTVQRLHQGRRGTPGRRQEFGKPPDMKLCGFDVGLEHRFFLIAGPCVIESEQLQMDTAGR